MQKILVGTLCFGVLIFSACSKKTQQALETTLDANLNTLTAAEKAAGWKLLFDGKTLKGWHNFQKQTIGSSWQVNDGAIMLVTEETANGKRRAVDGGDIVTDGIYENYELSLEWKIGDCGNSGIMFNVSEAAKYDRPWKTGPEIQVLDNKCHPDNKLENHRAGSLYDMIAPSEPAVNPANEWNQVKLIINNGKVEHWQNGVKVVEYEMFTDEWKTMIANSKFKNMKDFGTYRKGRIVLQDHSDPVWYRNIKIREL